MGISILLCPLAEGFVGLLVFFSIYGLCDGFYATSNFVLVIKSCSRFQSTHGYGWFFFSMSFGLASGPPLGGKFC
jgi:MFS family permease